MNFWNLTIATACSAFVTTALVHAEDKVTYFDYRDWSVTIDAFVTEDGETRTVCSARTGGDGDPTLSIEISDGDAGPPDAYPFVAFVERAPRGYNTMMQDGDRITFLFDDGDSYAGAAFQTADIDGFPYVSASPDYDSQLFVLQGMRRAGQLEIIRANEVVYAASMNGFSAAYLKVVDACGFSGVNVIE